MTMPSQTVRRATVEDVAKLVPLWQQENLPWEELEKRFKEFQVIEGEAGELVGAIGFQVAGHEAWLHDEAFSQPELADSAREKIWERIQVMARNHGLVRVWTGMPAPFWRQNGFKTPDEEVLTKLPEIFGASREAVTCVQLRTDPPAAATLDKEFALFKQLEREETEKIFRQAKALKLVAAALAVIVFLVVMVFAILFFRAQRKAAGQRGEGSPLHSETRT